MSTDARLFPRPKEFAQHGRARRFDPKAGIILGTAGNGDFARARGVIADELVKAFPRVRIYDVPTENAAWELRLALGFKHPEPEAYRLIVARSDFLAPGDDPESRKRYMDNLARVLDDAANFRSADR